MDLETVLRRGDDVVSADLADGQVALMNVRSGSYYALNEVGTRVWQMLDRPRSVGELCAQLQAEYEVDLETCRAHVLAYIANLGREKLVAVV